MIKETNENLSKKNWIHSPTFDLIFFFFGFTFLLAYFTSLPIFKKIIYFIRPWFLHLHTVLPIITLLFLAYIYSTKKFLKKIVIIYSLSFLFILLLFIYVGQNDYISVQQRVFLLYSIGIVLLLWQYFHFGRQNYGFSIIYAIRQGWEIDLKTRNYLNFYFIINVVFILPLIFFIEAAIGNWFGSFLLDYVPIFITSQILLSTSLILFIFLIIYLFIRNYKFNIQIFLTLLYPVFQVYFFSIVNNTPYERIVFFSLNHVFGEIGIHYLLYKKSHLSNTKIRFLNFKMLWLVTTIVCTYLLYLVLSHKSLASALVNGAIHPDNYERIITDSSYFWGVVFFYYTAFLHYVTDAYLFKLKDTGERYGIRNALFH